jgi:hypothetical protein
MKDLLLRNIFIVSILIIILGVTCSAPINLSSGNAGAEETTIAMDIQSTILAQQQTQNAQQSNPPNNEEQSQPAQQDSQMIPEQPSAPQEPPQVPPQMPPTYTPNPTYTPQPILGPTVPPLPTIAPLPTQPTGPSMDERIRSAKILVYDDSYGSIDSFGRGMTSRIDDALNGMGLTGGNVTNVHDAMGNFMSQLNSGTEWDLIIVGAENRRGIQGEFWDTIGHHINNNVAVIAEMWTLDSIANGRIAPVLVGCGIGYATDWTRKQNANLNDYLIYILEPSNPVFTTPNTIGMLIPTSDYAWYGDVGDRVKLTGGDAVLLAGSLPKEHSTYGLISSCHGGRVIFQTFDTHDYKYKDVIPLWQNYIHNTLTNHFTVTP